jgi:hypothetical protein
MGHNVKAYCISGRLSYMATKPQTLHFRKAQLQKDQHSLLKHFQNTNLAGISLHFRKAQLQGHKATNTAFPEGSAAKRPTQSSIAFPEYKLGRNLYS